MRKLRGKIREAFGFEIHLQFQRLELHGKRMIITGPASFWKINGSPNRKNDSLFVRGHFRSMKYLNKTFNQLASNTSRTLLRDVFVFFCRVVP